MDVEQLNFTALRDHWAVMAASSSALCGESAFMSPLLEKVLVVRRHSKKTGQAGGPAGNQIFGRAMGGLKSAESKEMGG
jgi:hypothetical protein